MLALGVLLWIAAVVAAVVPLLDEDVDDRLEAAPLPERACPGLIIGVNSTLAFERSTETRAATAATINEVLGAQVVRDSLLWHQVEPVEGERNWSSPDGAVEALRAVGIEPLMVVVGSPSWANGVEESTPGHYLSVPPRGAPLEAWLDRYADFLTDAVERYRGVVRRWEIWNEPNHAAFWRPQPDPVAYRQVYKTLRRTILGVDPNAEVAVGGIGRLTVAPDPDIPGLPFLRRFLRTSPPIDNVAIHPYTTDDHPPDVHIPGQNNFDDIERVRDQLLADGERPSIWVTEWGWSTATVGESLQARYVDRSLAMLENRYPYVDLATYFADRDRPPDLFHGLLHEGLEPKPAAAELRSRAQRAATRCHPTGS